MTQKKFSRHKAIKTYEGVIECKFNGEYEKALILAKRSLIFDPNNSMIWNETGEILEFLERNEESLKCYDKALKIESFNSKFIQNKAKILEFLEKYDEALECYDIILQINPSDLYSIQKKESLKAKMKSIKTRLMLIK